MAAKAGAAAARVDVAGRLVDHDDDHQLGVLCGDHATKEAT